MRKYKYSIVFLICFIIHKNNIVNSASIKDETIGRKSPVIFVPGDGGSQVEAKLSKPTTIHYYCQQHTDYWFNIWLNLELLVPLVIDCWIDNVKLYYDNITRKTHNSPGVEIRIPGWGNSEVVEWIDPSRASQGAYFKYIGDALVTNLSYERNRNIRGAPYDFRKGPNENTQWFIDMKKLIEDTYQQNDNIPITLITHSMGSPMTLLLLQNQEKKWKQKYIKRLISLAGAWAGSFKSVKVFAMGDDLGSYALSGKTLKPEQITSPSLAWLLPSPFFWKDSEVLVTTPSRNYTTSQLKQYFADIEYPTAWEMRKDNIPFSLNFSPPDVELHCLYGSKIPTVERLSYKTNNIASEIPTLIKGDGDGTVNARSLEACEVWKTGQKENITSIPLAGIDHMTILTDKKIIEYIQHILNSDTN